MSFGPIRLTPALLLAAAATVGGVTTAAQTAAPAAPTQPRPQPRGGYPLPALPAVFETFQQKVRVSVVERVVFNDKMWETRRETFLTELKQRIRDIRQGPDGLIYLLTEEVNGPVLRLEPVE